MSNQSRALWALVIVSSVVKVFDETMNSVSAGSRSRVASTKSVPSMLETKRKVMPALAVMPERLVGHHRPEVGAANADVDHVADALAGMALPRAAPDAVGEVGHLVEHGVDLGDNVLAVHDDGSVLRRAQGHMQHGAVLREVDLLPAEHGVDALAQAGFRRQLQQELEGFVGDAVLGVIQEEARRLRGHALAAFRVSREELPQMQLPGLLVVRRERLPGLAFGKWSDRCWL